jgi:hypothetical protein
MGVRAAETMKTSPLGPEKDDPFVSAIDARF